MEIAHPERDKQRALVGEAVAHVRRESFALAVPLLREATRLVPDDPFPFYLLGVSYRALREFDRCADALLELEQLDATFTPPNGLGTPLPARATGECLALAGKVEDATVRSSAPCAALDR